MIPAMVPAALLSRRSSQPPHFAAVSSRSRLTRPEEKRRSAHSRERLEALAEATAAAAAAESPEHDAQDAAAAASAILAAASPKRPGAGKGVGGGASARWAGPVRVPGILSRAHFGHCCPDSAGPGDSDSQMLLLTFHPFFSSL